MSEPPATGQDDMTLCVEETKKTTPPRKVRERKKELEASMPAVNSNFSFWDLKICGGPPESNIVPEN